MRPKDKEFIFEYVIERKGFYLMHADSYKEHQADPRFQIKMLKQGLKARYILSIRHYKFYYTW